MTSETTSPMDFLKERAIKIAEDNDAKNAANNPVTPRATKRTVPGPKPKRAARKDADKVDYTEGIQGLFQIVTFPLAFVAPADAATVSTHSPNIAKELNNLAQNKPEVAAVLDKVLAGGPYAALFAAFMPMGIQLAHNHNLIPENIAVQMGATPKRVIDSQLRAQASAMQAAAEQRAKEDAEEDAKVSRLYEHYNG